MSAVRDDDKVPIQCEKCGYKWRTSSNMMKVTCPSCQVKADNDNRMH